MILLKTSCNLPNFSGATENIIMQDFGISMYMLNMAAIAKHESDEEISADRMNKLNKYEYQTDVNTVIGSLRNRPAEAVFCSDSITKYKLPGRVFIEIQHSVIPKRSDDGSSVRFAYPHKSKFHHNKKSKAIPHKDCRAYAQSDCAENPQAGWRLSRIFCAI